MLYINKKKAIPSLFMKHTASCKGNYDKLGGKDKKAIEELLLEEQGGLCPFCEREASKVGGTIEHFLPASFLICNLIIIIYSLLAVDAMG